MRIAKTTKSCKRAILSATRSLPLLAPALVRTMAEYVFLRII